VILVVSFVILKKTWRCLTFFFVYMIEIYAFQNIFWLCLHVRCIFRKWFRNKCIKFCNVHWTFHNRHYRYMSISKFIRCICNSKLTIKITIAMKLSFSPLISKEVIRIRKSKDRQHNGQKKKDKQRSTKHTHKTKDQVTRTPLKICPGRVGSSCCTSCTRRINQADPLYIRKDVIIISINQCHFY
jgi:hypothetical protein